MRTLFPRMSWPTTAVVVVLAVVVTAVVKEVGVAVTDPVPVPFEVPLLTFTLLTVCVVMAGVSKVGVEGVEGELADRAVVVVVSVDAVNTASVLISMVWFLSSWFAWS